MQFFAAQGLLGPIDDVWEAGLNDTMSEGFKLASTGQDGQLYFVPWTYYAWGIHFRPSLFEENGWEVPATMDQLIGLAEDIQAAGIIPFAFGNDGRWPAMGTFDQLNFRMNGYQFHMDLMAGRESWTDERVRNVFTEWERILPFHQENPNGRKWPEAGSALVEKEAAMITLGNFVGQVFPDGDTSDLDFFPWPAMNKEFGTETVEAPIDGWMLAANPKNPEAAKELSTTSVPPRRGGVPFPGPDLPGRVAGIRHLGLHRAAAESGHRGLRGGKRDPVPGPRHQPGVRRQRCRSSVRRFHLRPLHIDGILEDMQAQAEAIFAE